MQTIDKTINKTIDKITECPQTPPSSNEQKIPMTTGARVYARLNKVLDSVERPNFASVLYDEDLTMNESTATAAGGGMNMTLLGEVTRLEDFPGVEDMSRVGAGLDNDGPDGVGNDTFLKDGDLSFQVEGRQVGNRGTKRAMDDDETGSVKRQKVAEAAPGLLTPTGNRSATIDETPPTSKRKKSIAVLEGIHRTGRKTATKKSPRKLMLASTPGVKRSLLSRSASQSLASASWTVPKMTRGERVELQSIEKPNFCLGGEMKKKVDVEEEVSPKTARRVVKSVTKSLSLSLRVSSTSSIDVEEFWRQLRASPEFSNLNRKRFDGIIANLHNRNRCFVSKNVIHRI